MSKSIVPQNSPNQLPLIPEEEQPRGVVIDGVAYISLYDTYRIYGHSTNPSRDWARDKTELQEQGWNTTDLVSHKFPDEQGKSTKKTVVINELQLARIAQVSRFREWEPARQRMAELLVAEQHQKLKRNENVTDYVLKGKSPEWALRRVNKKGSEEIKASALIATHESHEPNFGEIGATINRELFDMTVSEIVEQLGLLPKDKKNWQDHIGAYALTALEQINTTCAKRMRSLGRALSSDEQREIVRYVVRVIAPTMKELARYAGEDFLSGAPLDEHGNALIVRNVKLLK